MGTKRRGSKLDRKAKKIRSGDRNDNDQVSGRNSVQTTPASPRQPIADLDDLPQAARDQFNFLLQALGDISPESLYEVDILNQVNAINSNADKPIFEYEPPDITILSGHEHKFDDAHDCVETGCTEFYVKVKTQPYANGYFSVEVENTGMIKGDGSFSPYRDENPGD